MFVSTKIHRKALEDLAVERARRETIEREHASQKAIVGFLCARVNQLEAERAILLKHAVKSQIDFPVPSMAATVPVPADVQATMAGLPPDIFSDMGDDEARRRGIGWDRAGRVVDAADAVVQR